MNVSGMDISKVPFSVRGSYMAVNYLPEDYYSGYVSCTGFSTNLDKMPFVSTPGVYLRSVATKGQNNNMEMMRLIPLFEGKEAEYEIYADYGIVKLITQAGTISICFADENRLLIRGEGEKLGLKLECVIEGRSSFLVRIPLKNGHVYHKMTNHISFDNYGIYTSQGKVTVIQEWEPDHLLNTSCYYDIASEEGVFQCVIKELRTYIWANAVNEGTVDFHEAMMWNRESFDAFYRKGPSVPSEYEDSHRLATYLCWSASVNPRGYLKRESIFMTKNILCFVWAYESWLVAAGLCETDSALAYDQLMTMLDSQDELGGIPNFKGDGMESFEANMPPNLGWIVSRMMEKMTFTKKQLAELYERMSSYTRFYLNYMNENVDGVFEYHHGYDSCGDDDTVFRDELNITSPDLTTWIILQMDCLKKIAIQLGRDADAIYWQNMAERSTAGLLSSLFDENHIPFAINNNTGERIYAKSPIMFTPLMLGERLPKKVQDAILHELKNGKYLTDYGIASETIDSEYYQPEGFFRGPIWFTMTLTTIEGLIQCGEAELAHELTVKYCNLVKYGGCAECYHAETGEPLNNRGYVSTAGTFLMLLHYYL